MKRLLAMLGIAIWIPGSAPAEAGTLAYWRFEEPGGTIASDVSGNGNHGTLLNGAAFDAARAVDPVPRTGAPNAGSIRFDGVDDAVSAPDSPSLRPAGALTIEAWIRPESGAWVVLGKQFGPGCCANSYQFEMQVGGALNFILTDDAGAQHAVGTAAPPADVWTHIAGTWDGATMRLFVAGDSVAAAPFAGPIGYDGNPFLLGADDDGGGVPGCCFFHGLVDEVRISDVALDPSEFLDAEPPTALAWWRFEGNTDDSSGNGNTGILAGDATFDDDTPGTVASPGGEPNAWSLLLDGNGDAMTVPDSPTLRPSGALTVEAWVRPDPGAWVVIAKQIGSGCCADSYSLELRFGGPLNFILSDSTGTEHMATGPSLVPGVWTHVAGTWDGETMRVYVQGDSVAATSWAGEIGYDGNPVIIGADDDGGGAPGCCWFDGHIDEVRISAAALAPGGFLPTPAVASPDPVATTLRLEPARPNPSRRTTVLAYELPARGRVRATVHDVRGRTVTTLVDGVRGPGRGELSWAGTAASGARVPAGVYFVRIESGGEARTSKVVRIP